MKLNKKILFSSIAGILTLGAGFPVSQRLKSTPVAAATTSNNSTLKLIHGAYVYNKKGKRLTKYRGSWSNTHLHKGTSVKYTGAIQPIEKDSKQYYLLNDDNYNQSWLPYKKIKGKYYYSIGHGGYINAANVNEINGQPLYVANATVTVKISGSAAKNFSIGAGDNKIKIKNGMKLKVDYIFSDTAGNGFSNFYHVANTDSTSIVARLVKGQPRQRLATKTKGTFIQFTQATPAYSIKSILNPDPNQKTITINKDLVDYKQVIVSVYIWDTQDNKAELFYRLANDNSNDTLSVANALENNLFYIKAANVKYISGPQLTPINTPEEAKTDAKIATASDKQGLQKLIDQEKAITASSNYKNEDFVNTYKVQYDRALKMAKDVTSSTTASITEVEEATWLLNRAQDQLKNADKTSIDLHIDAYPANY
ncbi:SLAP domain-containing protein [Lactobacillus sp. ESL0731]|uniref:SLAP domain-containing protein n=1 Tax=unclassified Lactobacillus TaxID=2620435 RepID=UPI0023F6B806|nr:MULTISPECIES: SLAP domain-containing protein [unclassified Lactobacillus]WEV50837.1 SLAP domain-containing protein [Lactobacillus sp. ESL0700]WEV61968.1 SLAP domain-containing protein [Lactobacillus sp. ESL0731]